MKTTITQLFWSTIVTIQLFGAVVWNYIPSMRPDGVTNGDAAIILSITLIGVALLATAEARSHAKD